MKETSLQRQGTIHIWKQTVSVVSCSVGNPVHLLILPRGVLKA